MVGTQGNDDIDGTPKGDVIAALGGNDVVHSFGGNDRVCTAGGDDAVYSGGGDIDYVFTGSGNDEVRTQGQDAVESGPGNDTLHARDQGVAVAGKGADRVLGFSGALAGGGDDIIVPRHPAGVIDYKGGAGDDFVVGSDVSVETRRDELIGGSGDDLLRGKDGGDDFWPGPGRDRVFAGTGKWADTLYYDGADGIMLDLTKGIAKGDGIDHFWGEIDDVYGSRLNDSIYGSARQDYIDGCGGGDRIHGRAGDDILYGDDVDPDEGCRGDRGRDILHGGRGKDGCFIAEVVHDCEDVS